MILRFKKKPVIIEAINYDGNNSKEIIEWAKCKIVEPIFINITWDNPTGKYLEIKTLEGTMIAIVNDWIIKGIDGEFYPCKPRIFIDSYEKVTL